MAGDVPLRKYTWGRDLSGLRSAGSSPPGVAGTDGASALTAAADGFSALTAAGGVSALTAARGFSVLTVARAFSPVAGVAFDPVAADLCVGRSAGHGVPALQAAGGTLDTRRAARRPRSLRDRGHAPAGVRQGQVGGLLAVWDSNHTPSDTSDDLTYIFFYDANGNVSQALDVEDLANWQSLGLTSPADWHASRLAARYEYDPYGNLTGPDINGDGVFDSSDDPGPYAFRNPFRFSTKYFDAETNLGYWGYRYYWPKLGRWLSRDPIGELGGVNLCAYVENTPATATDMLGSLCAHPLCGGFQPAEPCDDRLESGAGPSVGPQAMGSTSITAPSTQPSTEPPRAVLCCFSVFGLPGPGDDHCQLRIIRRKPDGSCEATDYEGTGEQPDGSGPCVDVPDDNDTYPVDCDNPCGESGGSSGSGGGSSGSGGDSGYQAGPPVELSPEQVACLNRARGCGGDYFWNTSNSNALLALMMHCCGIPSGAGGINFPPGVPGSTGSYGDGAGDGPGDTPCVDMDPSWCRKRCADCSDFGL